MLLEAQVSSLKIEWQLCLSKVWYSIRVGVGFSDQLFTWIGRFGLIQVLL